MKLQRRASLRARHCLHDGSDGVTQAFLDSQARNLSEMAKVGVMGYGAEAWNVDDAPRRYVEVLKKAIVGVSIEITEIRCKHKMSQVMSVGDQRGVVAGLSRWGRSWGM